MKKMVCIGLFLLVCGVLSATVIIAQGDETEVFAPDYNITVNGENVQEMQMNPLIEYQGMTYLSLKDWGEISDSIVNEDGTGMFSRMGRKSLYGENVLFDDIESAKEIGEILAKDRYPNQMTEQSCVVPMDIELSGAFTYYSIYIFFDKDKSTEEERNDWGYASQNADAEIRYFVRSGEINYLVNRGNGRMEFETM